MGQYQLYQWMRHGAFLKLVVDGNQGIGASKVNAAVSYRAKADKRVTRR